MIFLYLFNRSSIKNDMSIKKVTESITLDRIEWWKTIYVADLDKSVEDP
jgi:hypothetical protein